MNRLTILVLLSVIMLAGLFYVNFFVDTDNEKNSLKFVVEDFDKLSETGNLEIEKNEFGFINISSVELDKMLKNKDFILIDVHVPEQEHIPETDIVIPYNKIEKIIEKIPNKNTKVVLYCRSGGMSKQVAYELAEKGYINVFNLENGLNEWKAESRKVLPKGSIK